jgi:hypothetical protein
LFGLLLFIHQTGWRRESTLRPWCAFRSLNSCTWVHIKFNGGLETRSILIAEALPAFPLVLAAFRTASYRLGHVMWYVWREEWHWDGYCPSISVSLGDSQSADCSTFHIILSLLV